MSHKIAKAVRKMLKKENVDVKQTVYEKGPNGTVVLTTSGRKLYKEMKKLAKEQND